MSVPGITSTTVDDRQVLLSDRGLERDAVIQDSSNSDSGASPTTSPRKGNVLTKRTSTGRYIEANDANADAADAAALTADATNPGSAAWDGTLTVSGHWGSVAVTLSSDDTDSAVVTAINAALAALNPEWGPCVATVSGSRVVITNRETGQGTWLKAVHGTVTGMFGTLAVGVSDQGANPEIVVIAEQRPLLDRAGAATHSETPVYTKAHLDESQLIIGGAAATSYVGWPEIKGYMQDAGYKFG